MLEISIKEDNATVGNATVIHQGLYYIFDCCCRFPDDRMREIVLDCGGRNVSLGVCVPDGRYFVLKKSVCATRIDIGHLKLYVKLRNHDRKILVNSKLPFNHLDKLDGCRICREGDLCYLQLSD